MFTIAITGHRPNKLPCGYNFLPTQSRWAASFVNYLIFRIIDAYHKRGPLRILSGMALGVDQLFCIAALEAKKRGAVLTLTACIPCHDYDAGWTCASRRLYSDILSRCDEKIYVTPSGYTQRCLQLRNEFLADHADELIAIWDGSPSGTRNCVNYAKSINVPVTIISPSVFRS